MAEFSGIWLLLLVLAIAGGILGVLNYLSILVRNQRMIHELKLEVVDLQSSYLRQLKERKESEMSGFDLGKESKPKSGH